MKIKFSNDKGVTLIALVTTIIVLIIISGTSITKLQGDQGIIIQSKKAREEVRATSIEEARDLWVINNKEIGIPKTLNVLLDELVAEDLLTKQEKQEILNSTPHQIIIGSKTIIFEENE